ncbi:efflux RND transporter permease subunit [Compostimonas suwonensis]|uniref:RND superfamily putative drug exporter n=1 Tax=Compostimonas suwonensis TaxID=1048394 RepID=A0A2M9BBE0_9MICO|nr:efflux RND transporter permease subunit [Compostimonas suwonensis]PJJ55260.1 RND superfamily putative drug exporter [Compostimonas suwonensis]
MSSVLYSLGRWAYRSRRLVLVLWLVILAAVGGGAVLLNQGTDNAFSIPGTESQEALDTLSRTFPQVSGASAQIVVVAPDGESVRDADVQSAVESTIDDLGSLDQVAAVTSPYDEMVTGSISDDGRAAIIGVQLDGEQSEITATTSEAIQAAGTELGDALPAGSQTAVGGQLFSQSLPTVSITELIGVLIALVVLILTFGSFLAAGMPLLTALLGVGLSIGLIFIATLFGSISSTTPLLALMLGLAVGIDYSLFIISRHQGQLRHGIDPEESAARSVATAGSAVVFAGLTVIIALLGLAVAQIPFLTTMGIAAAAAVAIAVLISVTLTPALLGFAGNRLLPRKLRAQTAHKHAAAPVPASASGHEGGHEGGHEDGREGEQAGAGAHAQSPASAPSLAHSATAAIPRGFFLGWVRAATKWPIVTVIAVIGVLGLAFVPASQLRLGLPDAGSLPVHDSARVTYDLISDNFGPGFNGPLIVTGSIISSTDPVGLMDELGAEIGGLDGVASIPLATPNETADTGIIQVIPEGGPNSEETKALVAEIRSLHDHFEKEFGVDLSVTGYTAAGIDISDRLGAALLPFGILVVGLSLVLLTMVFRSIAVPIKAALGYLLSVGAAFGAVTLVFENGVFADALNVATLGPVISFMPIILMGVLFGLAMDYEVFLVSRMREDYVHGGNARRAIDSGFVGSAKVVTAAAIIMISVFAAFIPEGDSSIKPIALGLAVGVFVDAFIVRMTLVPAVLALLGDKAWWMPRWLDRVLPSFDVEGDGLQKELQLADWPEPGGRYAIAADEAGLTKKGRPVYPPVTVRVPADGALVVHGPHRSGKSALLLTLAGRVKSDSGVLKVAGYVLPTRAAAVRARVAMVRLAFATDPVGDIRTALANSPAVLVLDDVDRLGDPDVRRAVRDEIEGALMTAHATGCTLTIVASCADLTTIDDILPAGTETVVVTMIPETANPDLTLQEVAL